MKKAYLILLTALLFGCQDLENTPQPKDNPIVPGKLELKLISPGQDSSEQLIFQVTNIGMPVKGYYCRGWVKQGNAAPVMLNKDFYPIILPDSGSYELPSFNNGKKYGPKDRFYFSLHAADTTLLIHDEVKK